MEHAGVVSEATGDRASVVLERTEGCGSCRHEASCGAGRGNATIAASNPVNAQPGDLVRLDVESSSVVLSAAVLFGLPLVMLIAGCVIGMTCTSWRGGGAIGAVIGFALSVGLAGWCNRTVSRRAAFDPVITAVLRSAEPADGEPSKRDLGDSPRPQ